MDRTPDLDDSLQDLSERAARRLIVLDSAMHVVAWSIHESDDDRRRLSAALAHSDSWDVPTAGPEGFSVEDVPELGRCLVISLHDHRHRVGHLLTVLDGPRSPSADEVRVLLDEAPVLGVLLSLRTLYAARDRDRARTLLTALVAGDPGRRPGAAEALVGEGLLGSSRQYCAVVLGADPLAAAPDEAGRTVLAVHRTLDFVARSSTASVVGSTFDDGTGVLVFPRPVVVPRLARILARPDVDTVRAGIGPVVGSLLDVHRSFRLARRTWRTLWLDPLAHGPVSTWDDAGLDGLLAMLPLESMTAEDLPLQVRRVLAAGLAPELLRTLETYLDCGGDAQRTAAALHIHRSTFYYRLDRLKERLDLELDDGRTRSELHVGLRVARLARLRPPGP
ncbi:CdaR family transcriptional regulator [uncultured Kocuria sp.]|uniref:PucR family transcriptional regulator n=1 Tax=uncultured Kocuria sp. TaxID=259305 RepID=UPI002631A90C|nr:PucR family transcriptional regulator [uncultured Kocuria sp.]